MFNYSILAETVDRNHKKYQTRLKKMEQQMLAMVERHNSQVNLYSYTNQIILILKCLCFKVKTLQQRIATLETPPTNSSENSTNSVAV